MQPYYSVLKLNVKYFVEVLPKYNENTWKCTVNFVGFLCTNTYPFGGLPNTSNDWNLEMSTRFLDQSCGISAMFFKGESRLAYHNILNGDDLEYPKIGHIYWGIYENWRCFRVQNVHHVGNFFKLEWWFVYFVEKFAIEYLKGPSKLWGWKLLYPTKYWIMLHFRANVWTLRSSPWEQ